jgi:glucosamine-6-phosphate deaminase
MRDKLFSKVNIDPTRTHIPDGMDEDAEHACRSYDEIIKRCGGIDLQLLGLGHNGHIGFNEPGTAFEAQTHLVNLTETTKKANQRFFENEENVPSQAYTMGIKSIMQAKKIVVVVSGQDKAEALRAAVKGAITPNVQASVLQLHNDVTIVADVEACSLLED